MKNSIFTIGLILFSNLALCAQTVVVDDGMNISSNFFIVIIAGVILALAFQFILTALSVAVGVTAIGDVRETFVKSNANPGKDSDPDDYKFDQDYGNVTPMGVKITSGFGIWSVITTSIALFGATAIAINLSTYISVPISLSIALVVWALFFIILFYFEARIANTVIGGLINTAVSGLRASSTALQSLFTPSDAKKADLVIGNTVDRIRKEFDAGFDSNKLSNVLDSFLNKVDNKIPNYNDLKRDLESIASKASSKNSAGKYSAIQQVLTKAIDESSESDDSKTQGKVEQLKKVASEIKQSFEDGNTSTEGIKNVVTSFSSMDKKEINDKISQFENSLRTAVPDSFNKESLQKTISEIIDNPKVISSMISDNSSQITKENIVKVLSQNTNLEKDKLNTYADSVDNAVQSIIAKFDKNNEDSIIKAAEKSIASFLNNTGKKELNYDELKQDVIKMIDNPADSFDIIKSRVDGFDINTARALITNNKYIDESHIDNITSSIDDAKSFVQNKVSDIETKARQQFEMTKRKAVIQAEHTRKTAASAAWWLVISAIISALAGMGGSLIAF